MKVEHIGSLEFLDVTDCPRCGGAHAAITFRRMPKSFDVFTHTGECPQTNSLILLSASSIPDIMKLDTLPAFSSTSPDRKTHRPSQGTMPSSLAIDPSGSTTFRGKAIVEANMRRLGVKRGSLPPEALCKNQLHIAVCDGSTKTPTESGPATICFQYSASSPRRASRRISTLAQTIVSKAACTLAALLLRWAFVWARVTAIVGNRRCTLSVPHSSGLPSTKPAHDTREPQNPSTVNLPPTT